jgi:uncharacterized protein (DUF1778 family)
MAKKKFYKVQVSFTEDQRMAIRKAADAEALSISGWIRHSILQLANWTPPAPKGVDAFGRGY